MSLRSSPRFLFSSLLVLVAVASAARAAPAEAPPGPDPLITNVDARRTTSLDGAWRTIVDAFEKGYYDYRYQPRADGYFLDRKAQDETERVEYDFDASATLLVPGDWNTQRESLLLYEGSIWYRQHLRRPARRRGLAALRLVRRGHLEAARLPERRAAGGARGRLHPLQLRDHRSRVRPDGNVLVVKADNARRAGAVPTLDFDWWNYGGITRPVRLVEVPGAFVEDYVLQLAKGSRDRVRGWVKLDGAQAGQKVTVRIPGGRNRRDGDRRRRRAGPHSISRRGSTSGPRRPEALRRRGRGRADTVHDPIGFRTPRDPGHRDPAQRRSRSSCAGSAPTRRPRTARAGPSAPTTRGRCWAG